MADFSAATADYTQMTDEEIANAILEAQAIFAESERRAQLNYAPQGLAEVLNMVLGHNGDRVQTIVDAIARGHGDITDPLIVALQATVEE